MSDDNLIARLTHRPPTLKDIREAADALEAQARRIAELGDANVSLANLNEGLMKMLMNRDARIAALEAEVEFWKEQRNRTFDMCMGGPFASAYANASIKATEKKA